MMDDRGRIRVPDAIAATTVVVAGAVVAPVIYDLLGGVAASGSLTAILLQLVVPSIFIGVVISLGVSGVRDLGGARQ